MHLKGAWKLKYEAKGIRCVRHTLIESITPFVTFDLDNVIEVMNVILFHNFDSGIGIHFVDLSKSDEYDALLENFEYTWDNEGLKVTGKKL